jgi:predicted RNase H-like nuclease (RuvC/YqgF family)
MNNLQKLENIQFVVNELTNSIKNQIIKDNKTNNKRINSLEKNIQQYNSERNEHFKCNYNIGRLKNIIDSLFLVIKEQDKRITQLENNLIHNKS